MSELKFNNVSKRYQQTGTIVSALNGCTLELEEGDFVCVVGPSGTGKTTLLNIAAGFENPDEGMVTIDNEPITRPGPDRAVVFQAPNLFPWLTAAKNVEQGLKIKGLVRSQRKKMAEDILHEVGLRHALHKHPHQLSGGMQQRVGIARAIVMQPNVLLMDEPFAALDPFVRAEMQNLTLKMWKKWRTTTLFITHSIDEALNIGNKIAVMRAGKIEDLIKVPQTSLADPTAAARQSIKQHIEGLIESGVKHDRGN
ncbi:ABC transporter ATP-binding protein [Acidihalobacter ferrooxydans]|uniref:ABC transporter domain-containing protein n=1 Tax=Acidihalobacter ferrooxydans TaxID=1765967 RepID=A0A1P8UIV6_9GAMM|nr:ABC transporter ATP-binding protein [Acidihalobacter ferrooxydans]APZ43747.1 hypothetical protein BW247_12165 [Acidihalobacter ferrooxydans]